MFWKFVCILVSATIIEGGVPSKNCIYNGTLNALEENCTTITGNVIIKSTDVPTVLYNKFVHTVAIDGCVQIEGTQLQGLDMFARLLTVKCVNSSFAVDFYIGNNTQLERLGMPVLTVDRLGLTSNPKLCLTHEEMIRHKNIQRAFTDNILTCQGKSGEVKECNSTASSANAGLIDGCEIVLGDLYIEGMDNADISNKL
ncbi:unnamed protein product [Caenorhabditis bovis]|uniref:Receptor L-domain domain-containing protein n=1 Tax=Caenorhabditis bovis TaxID=2654633 RepID=A0A8S1EM70_9PELO|nr:unnamed protein product [Caenorhabditis bovis]